MVAAWQAERALRCQVCGMWEWQEGMYEADIWLCVHCRDRDAEQHRLHASTTDQPMFRWGKHVRFFQVTPNGQ